MAVVTAPGGSSLLGKAARTRAAGRLRKRAVAVGGGVREHLLTVAALGCLDYAGFLHSRLVGFVVLGAALIVADFKIQG